MTESNVIIPRMETMRALAKQSNVPYCRIRAWCLEGKLPYIKSGNRFLVNVDSFVELLKGGQDDSREA